MPYLYEIWSKISTWADTRLLQTSMWMSWIQTQIARFLLSVCNLTLITSTLLGRQKMTAWSRLLNACVSNVRLRSSQFYKLYLHNTRNIINIDTTTKHTSVWLERRTLRPTWYFICLARRTEVFTDIV